MAVTEWNYPGACQNVNYNNGNAWSNPGNATADDDTNTSCTIRKNSYDDYLRCYNYGFSLADIPAGATIDGIEVQIEHYAAIANALYDHDLRLYFSGAYQGDNKGSAASWSTARETWTYGDATDNWNSSISDVDIRDSNFSVYLSAGNSTGFARIAYVDYIRIRVHYTPAGTNVTITDSGTGSDAIGQVQNALSILDSGSCTESFSGQAVFSVLDAGNGVDSMPAISVLIQVIDSATASEIIKNIKGRLIHILDTGIGLDSIIASSVSVTVSDIAQASDLIQQVLNSLTISDSGIGTEVITKIEGLPLPQGKITVTFNIKKVKPNFKVLGVKGVIN